MPYKSMAQERFFHSPGAQKAGITPSTVKEFDSASKGMSLPSKVPSAPKEPSMPKAPKPITSLAELKKRANAMGASSMVKKDKEAY